MTYLNRGTIRSEKGEFPAAIEDFGKAITLKSDLPASYLSRGLSYSALGSEDLAQRDFDEALKIEPSYKKGLKKRIEAAKAKRDGK